MKQLYSLLFIIALFILSCTTANNPTYQLTTTVSPTEGGSISPSSGVYAQGEMITLTATPSTGWRFVRWEGDWSSNQNPSTLTMTKDYSVVGIFEKRNYPLTINIEGYGEVEERVIQLKTTEYPYQTVVELTPVPDEGWRFVEWSGDLSGSEVPKQITVDGEKTVTAKFERKDYPLTINVVGEGTVKETVLPQRTTQYPFETAVILESIPSEGWEFLSWSGDLNGEENPQLIVVDGDKTVTATFQLKTYPVNVSVQGNGTITVEPQQEVYAHFSTVTFNPNTAEGWEFIEWSGDVGGNTVPLEVTITSELNIVGVFERKDYPLTVNVVGDGTVEERIIPQRTTQYPFETVVELTSIPSVGWQFVSWSGDLSGIETPQKIVLDGDKTVIATFQLKTYPVNILVDGSGTISTEPQQEVYQFGSTVTLTPNPLNGWEFVKWGGDVSGNTVPLEVTVTNELNIIGVFGRKDYPLTLNVVGDGTVDERIIPQRTTQHPFETLVELTPVPSVGSEFVEWSGDLSGSQSPETIMIDSEKTVTATFQLKTYLLNVAVEGSGTVIIEPQQEVYQYGSQVKLRAIPLNGWKFDKWFGDFNGNQNPIQTIITNNSRATASFVDGVPILLTYEPENIEPYRVQIRGQIIDNRGAQIISRGICYSTNQNPTTDNNYLQIQGNNNNFQVEISGLEQNTVYYVRTCVLSVFDITGLTSYHYGNEVIAPTTSLIVTQGEGLTDIVGNNYKTVIIRNQEWMAENLKTTRYNNGDPIPNLTSNQIWATTNIGAWSSYDNQESNSNNFGHLYNWFAASDQRNICPIGWRVPAKHDWEVLLEYLGGNSVSGGRLKLTGTEFWEQPNMGATNESGFSAKAAGIRYDDGRYSYLKKYTYWWTNTQATSIAAWRSGIQNSMSSDFGDGVMRDGYSIRCMRNL